MVPEPLFLAIQGAAKSTHLAACDGEGNIHSHIILGPLTPKVSHDFKGSLAKSLELLRGDLGLGSLSELSKKTQTLCLAMSGISMPIDEYSLLQNLEELQFRQDQLVICEDVWAALAAEGLEEGVVVMASTGANVFVRNEKGESITVGGWGSEISDQGSGFFVGMMSIRRILEYMDGIRRLSSEFVTEVLSFISLETPIQLVPWYHEVRKTSQWRSRIADIAIPVTLLAEEARDHGAMEILNFASSQLVASTIAALQQAGKRNILEATENISVVLSGGLGVASSTYFKKLQDGLKETGANKALFLRRVRDLKKAHRHPVAGALAFALAGGKTLPSKKLFDALVGTDRFHLTKSFQS